MIRSFSASNFHSIGNKEEVDLTISQGVPDPDGRFISTKDSVRLPSVVGFFGANAAGKTSFLRIPRFLSYFISSSFLSEPDERIVYETFLSDELSSTETELSIEFDLPFEQKSVPFQYHLVLTPHKVLHERLEYSPEGKKRKLFERDGNRVTPGKDFDLSAKDPIVTKVRPNASVISTFAQFNHAMSSEIRTRASRVISNLAFYGRMPLPDHDEATKIYHSNDAAFSALREFICNADIGVEEVELRTVEGNDKKKTMYPIFQHSGLSRPLRIFEESHGTANLYSILSWVFPALQTGSIAIIDDFDSDLHPLLIPKVLELFQDKKINPYGAQLLFSGHNPYTLTSLEKDELFFVEKDDMGCSHVYGLKDIKGVRRTDNFLAKYLSGQYGAIPTV